MHTIVLATQKGGSGKSTLAIGLALAAIQAGHSVRLIETDSQGTLSNWQNRRPYAEPIVEPVYARPATSSNACSRSIAMASR
jgi:chromosome partitioning protein